MGEGMNRLGGINRTFRLIIGVINERSLSAGGDHGVNLKSRRFNIFEGKNGGRQSRFSTLRK